LTRTSHLRAPLPHCRSSHRLLGQHDSTLQQVPLRTLSRSWPLEAAFRSPVATAVTPPQRGRRSRPTPSTAIPRRSPTRSILNSRPAFRQFVHCPAPVADAHHDTSEPP
jgi:hypothetical protein